MKKLKLLIRMSMIIMLSIVLLIPTYGFSGDLSKSEKATQKMIQKKSNKRAKQLKKEGWKADGPLSLEDQVFKVYLKLMTNDDWVEKNAVVAAKTPNQATSKANFDCITQFYEFKGTELEGKMFELLRVDEDSLRSLSERKLALYRNGLDEFMKAFRANVKTRVEPIMYQGFKLTRERNGLVEYNIAYVVKKSELNSATKAGAKETINAKHRNAKDFGKVVNSIIDSNENEMLEIIEEL